MPESTMRLVDALIKAKKDFELLVVPLANHGAASPVTQRRTQDFFVHHLMGPNPLPQRVPCGGYPRIKTMTAGIGFRVWHSCKKYSRFRWNALSHSFGVKRAKCCPLCCTAIRP